MYTFLCKCTDKNECKCNSNNSNMLNIKDISIEKLLEYIKTNINEYDNIKDILSNNNLLNNIILYHIGKAGIGNREHGGFDINYINNLKNFINTNIDDVSNKTSNYLTEKNSQKELDIQNMMNTIINNLFTEYLIEEKEKIFESASFHVVNTDDVNKYIIEQLNSEQEVTTYDNPKIDDNHFQKKYLKYKRKYLQLKYNR